MTPASPRVRSYLAGWRVAGVLAVLVAFAAADVDWDRIHRAGGVGALVALLIASIIAQRLTLELEVRSGDEQLRVSLAEAAFATTVLVVGGLPALVVLLVSVATVQAATRTGWVRASFNVAQFAVAAAVSLGVHAALLGPASPLGGRGIVAITAAMVVFGLVNWIAVTGAVSLVSGRSVWATTSGIQRLSGASTLGNTTVGIVTALVWSIHPAYALLMLVPLVTLFAAYRGTARAAQLLRQVTADRDRIDRVIGGASDGIALLDHGGRVELWSPALARLTGVPAERAVGRALGDVLALHDAADDPPGRQDPTAVVASLVAGDPRTTLEGSVVRDDGSARLVRVTASGLFEAGTRSGTVLLVHDVTREREADRLKDDFLMRVSHELRTPLTPIKGFASTLLAAGDRLDASMVRDALERILDRADHMVGLVDDLLLVARERPGQARPAAAVPDPVDLADLARAAVERWRDQRPGRRLLLAAETAVVGADAGDVARILDALIDNALRYSPPSAPVDIAVVRSGHLAQVHVTDRGDGIPVDALDTIFERFHRLEDPLRMTTGGLGVGLTIARSLAERAGGALRVSSRPGVGSTFVLDLPLVGAPAARQPADVAG